jgi:large subunit ribosomal protein L23
MANTPTERMYQLFVRPLVTEKTTKVAEDGNWLTFEVLQDATKPELKAAFERLYGVEVLRVNTLTQKGKKRTRNLGTRSDVKKALIKLKDGASVDLSAGAK